MSKHISVLSEESINALNLKSNSTVVDATLGSGGHAKLILKKLGKKGTLVAIDVDQCALDALQDLKENATCDLRLVCGNYRDIVEIIRREGFSSVDAILADLGWRTEQFLGSETIGKGFSFTRDEPLLMTYGNPEDYVFTAYDVVNSWEEDHLADVIFAYGEERNSRRIAKTIVEARKSGPIETSGALAYLLKNMSGVHRGKIHPATKTFQAIRIVVNDELGSLSALLKNGFEILNNGGRFAVITFHSLEDRIVKHTFKEFVRDQKSILVSKKPIFPTRDEVLKNKRARSAKLRVIEKHI